MNKLLVWLKPYISLLLFAVPVVAGAGFLVWAIQNRAVPEKVSEKELRRTVRVIDVQPLTVVPKAIGYGESNASNSFQAIAEVKGRIVQLHPELKSGSFIRAGEILIAIDKKDIEINIQKLEAEIERAEASVQELKVNEQNLKASIAIEKGSLELAEKEWQRMQILFRQNNGAIAESEVDAQRRSVLGQQQAVQNLQSSLDLLPAQIKSAEASISVSNANLDASKRDLDRCQIISPFNCRLGPVELEVDEVVSVGQQLLTAQSIDKIEVEAQFGLDRVAKLVQPGKRSPALSRNLTANPQEMLRKFFDVEATVRYGTGDFRAAREAKFERLREQLDEQSRTVGIVVSIDNPYQREGEARRDGPPPVPGTYCEVELRGQPIEQTFVIPRASLREATVFLVDGDNRLSRRRVEIQLVQQDFAAVTGLESGDRVIVSDPTPAIEGMLVEPQLDRELAESLRIEAGGGN